MSHCLHSLKGVYRGLYKEGPTIGHLGVLDYSEYKPQLRRLCFHDLLFSDCPLFHVAPALNLYPYRYMSHSLNSLKLGDYVGECYRGC